MFRMNQKTKKTVTLAIVGAIIGSMVLGTFMSLLTAWN